MNLGQGSDQKEGEHYRSLYFKRILVLNSETILKSRVPKFASS